MLYCDAIVNGKVAWTGVPCLNGVPINLRAYLGLEGKLVFLDSTGSADPYYEGLADRFLLLYVLPGQENLQVPLKAVPAQQFDVVLADQNCTLSLYTREAM